MISKASTVADYIAELPLDRQPVIEKLRHTFRKRLIGYEETMAYGMPVYKRNGVVEVSFASQKQYIAVYVLKKDVLDEFRAALTGADIGKGCVRFTRPERIDFDVLEQLLQRNVESDTGPC